MIKMIIYRFEKINGVWHWNYIIRPYDRILYRDIQNANQTAGGWLDVQRWDDSKEYWDAETEASSQESKLDWIFNKRDKSLKILNS